MSPRPRKRQNKGLPPNLYSNNKGKKTYYSYKNPETKEFTGFGTDRLAAIDAANELNSILIKQKSLVDRVLTGKTITYESWADKYIELRKQDGLSKNTMKVLKSNINKAKSILGLYPISDIDVFEASELLDLYVSDNRASTAQQLRSMLITCFDYAMAKGHTKDNPFKKTLPVKAIKKRQRMSLEAYKVIVKLCEHDIKDAAIIALHTLQRREDIARFKFEDYDFQDKIWRVVQIKTKAPLAIQCNDTVHNIIMRRYKAPILPKKHVIYHSTSTGGCRVGDSINKETITGKFTEAVIKSGLYKDLLDDETHPTFHELRSLGIHLYEKMGVNAQALAGHATRDMTERYLSGHGVEYEAVKADLTV